MRKFLFWLQERIKSWIKPATPILIIDLLSDLIVENALLRQQLIILKRQVKRPQLSNPDRIRLVLLSHFTKFWKQTLPIIQPDTLLSWHRNLFRNYWRRKSQGRPRVASEMITLIRSMVKENKLWGSGTDSRRIAEVGDCIV